jgi:putative phosphoesterase
MEAPVEMSIVKGARFGLTADTHDDKTDWPALLASLKAAWGPIDGVLHCGDISTAGALQALTGVAPVYATRSSVDPPPAPPVLEDGPRVLEIEGVRVGLTFSLGDTPQSAEGAAKLFGGPVAACIFGSTHAASLAESDGVLFVNPGSPSLAKNRTAAVLTVADGKASAEIVAIG